MKILTITAYAIGLSVAGLGLAYEVQARTLAEEMHNASINPLMPNKPEDAAGKLESVEDPAADDQNSDAADRPFNPSDATTVMDDGWPIGR